jgi:hypothetical protein
MSQYDLRSLFPYSNAEFGTPEGAWVCRLAEVSDQRPDADRLSWYLVFEHGEGWHGPRAAPRKLEIVTTANRLIANGFPPEAETRIANWLAGQEQEARLEWLEI